MDELREDTRERTWEDYVEDAGAVLAIGAGAAYYLKHGGAKHLNRLGEYVTAAKLANAKGAFDDIRHWDQGVSEVKRIADLGRGKLNKVNLADDPMLQELFYGFDIRNNGKRKSTYLQNTNREFRLAYGDALFDQILGSSENHYIDEKSARNIKGMFGDLLKEDESQDFLLSGIGIRAKLETILGEDTPNEMMDEAVHFAEEIQRKMSASDVDLIADTKSGKDWIINVGEFKGFDQNGIGIWDTTNVVEQIKEADPAKAVESLADESFNMLKHAKHQEELYSGRANAITDSVLGEHVTIKDLLEAIDRNEFNPDDHFTQHLFKRTSADDAVVQSSWQSLMDIRAQINPDDLETFDKTIISGFRRDAEGKIYSTAGMNSLGKSASEALSGTIFGKMIRATELLYNQEAPGVIVFGRGSLDQVLADALPGSENMETSQRVVRMFGNFYSYNGSKWEEIEALRNHTVISSRVGSGKDLLQGMRDKQRGILEGKTWKDSLKIGFDISPLSEEYGNQMDTFIAPKGVLGAASFRIMMGEISLGGRNGAQRLNQVNRFLKEMDRYVHINDELNVDDLTRLKRTMSQDQRFKGTGSIEALDQAIRILKDPTGERAARYAAGTGITNAPGSIENPSLAHLLANYQKDPIRTKLQYITFVDQAKKGSGGVHFVSMPFEKNLAQELVRESFMRARATNERVNYNAATMIDDLLKNSGFTGEKERHLRHFAALSLFDSATQRTVYDQRKEDIAYGVLQTLRRIHGGQDVESRFIFDAFQDVKARYNFKDAFRNGDNFGFSIERKGWDKTNDWLVIHKAYSFPEQFKIAADIVRNSNDKTRARALINAAREASKPITQLISGNDAFQAGSTLSNFLYHAFYRFDEQFNFSRKIFGHHIQLELGLRPQDKGSTAEIINNWTLKRVLPAAAIYTYLDFADDTARAITGMGLGEAGVSGLANAYLGVKKITGATGLDYVLKGVSSDNPLFQYYGGYTGDISGTWNTYEEQKDYYERGYTPIRKARFWAFGSSNEYRGGKVSYFEPNTLRMMRSNYYMESMYEGSMWTKWSHSLLPTPLNPLSPLNYWRDPYYLEELHKEDRPYPVTGSTFAENTPWGIALNPFFDSFVKPRRQMYRDRLNEDGIDIKALIAHINDNIRRRANNQQNGDILYLQNGKLRSMLFTAFNAPTPSERIIGQKGTSVTASTEYGEYGAGIEAEEYPQLAESNAEQMQSQVVAGSALGIPTQAEKLSVSDRLVISSAKGNIAATALVDTMKATGVFDALRGANLMIRQKGMLRKDQGLFYENKMQYENPALEDVLSQSETISDLMTQAQGHDYLHEMAVSARMITGLYGYMANVAFGIGENNQKRIATSQNMESFGRSFWDLSVGGFDPLGPGSEVAEVFRRFIPEYHRMQQVNPLMNTMPDWLPERMRFGDPYAQLPKGEARLPGRGYESLNQLHPDIYGRYGAFDRFKILADVAPYSPEYKFWKKVVGATIQDPELKKEIQEIKDRVAEQTKGHDFFDYKYLGRGMTQQNAIVSEVMNFGKFKIVGSEQVYKLSGVKIAGNPNETTQQVLSRYLLPGQEITMFMDENPAYARNNDKDQTINAGVMVAGENIAEQMMEAGDAKVRKGDTSAPSYMLKHGPYVNTFNKISELIGHANIPIIHSRLLKMDSPLESYKDDNLYGTSFQSWSDVMGTFVRPAFQIESSDPFWFAVGIGGNILNNNMQNLGNPRKRDILRETAAAHGLLKKGLANTPLKWAARTRFLDRGALIGHFAGQILFLGNSGATSTIQKMQGWGHKVGVAYAALANPDNLGISTLAWSRIGYLVANEVLQHSRLKGTLAGAAIGLARWASAQKLLSDNDLAGTYVPDSTKKKWDMQEYFDRLTYVKYMGLFEQAADMAKEKEGIDIRRILASQERERKEILEQKEKLHQDLLELDRKHDADSEEAKKIIRKKLSSLSGVKLGLRGGEFTKSAIMYKNVADATMYGLDEHAMMADIVRALPKTERDYFIEFMKEKDKDKREEILKTVSPLLNRALRTIWKMPLPEKVSNEEYFEHHTLPAPTWAGWRPDIDLANVAAKVIRNEGMQFSDMGIYASQYRESEVQEAPNIEYNTSPNSMLMTRLKLQMVLTGTGLDADKVSVEPSQDSGIQVIANVARVIPYKISEEVNNLFDF